MEFDKTALGSDIARDRKQARARAIANFVVKVFGLNKPGPIATEIVQAIHPTAQTIHLRPASVPGRSRTSGARTNLLYRRTDTIEARCAAADRRLDIGANVGLYSIYVQFRNVASCFGT